jgi:hypothetical protein
MDVLCCESLPACCRGWAVVVVLYFRDDDSSQGLSSEPAACSYSGLTFAKNSVVILTGVLTGMVCVGINRVVETLVDWRNANLGKFLDQGSVSAAYGLNLAYGLTLTAGAASLVRHTGLALTVHTVDAPAAGALTARPSARPTAQRATRAGGRHLYSSMWRCPASRDPPLAGSAWPGRTCLEDHAPGCWHFVSVQVPWCVISVAPCR